MEVIKDILLMFGLLLSGFVALILILAVPVVVLALLVKLFLIILGVSL